MNDEQDYDGMEDPLGGGSAGDAVAWVNGRRVYSPGPGFRQGSPFGVRNDPMVAKPKRQFHNGQDHPAAPGTRVPAGGAGEVVFSGWNKDFGNTVIVQHRDDDGETFQSLYAHLNGKDMPKRGDQVRTGDKLGEVGRTGARTTGPHLHMEVVKGQATLDAQGRATVPPNDRALRRDPANFLWPTEPSASFGPPRLGVPYAPPDQPGAWAPWLQPGPDWRQRGLLDPAALEDEAGPLGGVAGLLEMGRLRNR